MFLDVNINANQLVDQIAKIASPAAQQVLQAYVKQQIVQGNIDLTVAHWGFVVGFILLGIAAAFLVLAVFAIINDSEDGVIGGFGFFTIFCVLAGISILGVGVNNQIQGTQLIENPQYYAIQQMINDFHP